MGWFKKKPSVRADTENTKETEDALITALLGKSEVTIKEALAIPDVQYCLDVIGGTIAGLPIKLYKKTGDKVEELEDDSRVRLLNKDTGDTLTATQFWKAMLQDYFFGRHGGFAYIKKNRNRYTGLHYIDSSLLSCAKTVDPIFKDYDVSIQGKSYMPYDFLKILRKTKDGCNNGTILEEASLLLSVAYTCYTFENDLVKKGGSKKGFIKSQKKLSEPAMNALKAAYRMLHSNGEDNVVVLNDGLEFQDAANSSVEMQLSDHINNNMSAIRKLFGVTDDESFTKSITRIIQDIECSLNRDLLKEAEKGSFYFAFDTREIIRGSIKERYEAYAIALEHNFLQIDDVRKQEDLNPLGIEWLALNLGQVLYDPKTKECYTPNTKEIKKLDGLQVEGGEADESRDKS